MHIYVFLLPVFVRADTVLFRKRFGKTGNGIIARRQAAARAKWGADYTEAQDEAVGWCARGHAHRLAPASAYPSATRSLRRCRSQMLSLALFLPVHLPCISSKTSHFFFILLGILCKI